MSIPSIKWDSIELPKALGGLGVGNIMYKNLVLLFKWWWRFLQFDNTLWKRILMSVYNIKGLKASRESFHLRVCVPNYVVMMIRLLWSDKSLKRA